MDFTRIKSGQIEDGSINLSVDVANTLPVASGGTGATDAETARSNLGAIDFGEAIVATIIFG
jgi:hypothetical protein